MTVDGNEENSIAFYSKNLDVVIENATQLLRNFKDAEIYGMRKCFRLIQTFLKRINAAFNFVLNEAHINNLIQAAKHIESLQYMALSTMLLVQIHFK